MMTENKLHFVKSFLLIIGISMLLILNSSAVSAQQDDTEELLLRSIEQTRQQLETEQQRIVNEEESQEKELQEAKIYKEQLIEEIVERKFAIAQKEAKLESLRKKREEMRDVQDKHQQQWTEIRMITTDAWHKLADLVDTLPVSETRQEQKKLLKEIESNLQTLELTQINIIPKLKLIESLLEESRTSAVFRANIRNARGDKEEVQILRIGQILFAYKSLSSGQIAIAATSKDEKGFRWNENVPKWAKREINHAINGALRKGNDTYYLPVDVTQQMSVERYDGRESTLSKMAAGGPVMIPLAIVAMLALVLIIERFIFLSKQGHNAVEVAEDILASCHSGNFQKAERIAVKKPSIVSRTLLACLSHRLDGIANMEDAVAEAILHELPKVERFLPTIGILAGIAPLLGLLGTVTGMIATFNTITMFGSGQPRLMAGGISEALITTATGLAIAIPVLLVHSFLTSRSDKMIADTERFAATLVNMLRKQQDKSDV